MAKILVKRHVHASKEDNFDLEEQFDSPELLYTCYEVELLVEIDTETFKTRIVGVDGRYLGKRKYTDQDVTEVKEVSEEE